MTQLHNLDRGLQKGLYLKNLDDMIEICKELEISSDSPLPFYILRSVFADLSSLWTDRPLPEDIAEHAETELLPLFRAVIKAIEQQSSRSGIYEALDKLISCFIHLQVSGQIIV